MRFLLKHYLTVKHQTVIAGLTRNLLNVRVILLAQEMADPCPP